MERCELRVPASGGGNKLKASGGGNKLSVFHLTFATAQAHNEMYSLNHQRNGNREEARQHKCCVD